MPNFVQKLTPKMAALKESADKDKDPTAGGKLDNSRSGKVNKAAKKPRIVQDKNQN